MNDVVRKAQHGGRFARHSTSRDGYGFQLQDARWTLSKDVTIHLDFLSSADAETGLGFRATLSRYAEEASARHTENMATRFKRYLRDTGASRVTTSALIKWRSMLGTRDEYQLGGLRGFLLAWHEYGFPGLGDDVIDLLETWTIKGNVKGAAVAIGCPETGPLTDLEIHAIYDWANAAVTQKLIPFERYAYLLALMMTARRPVQIAALRGKDLITVAGDGPPLYRLEVPRAKQRGIGFRGAFRSLPIIADLWEVLRHQHRLSVQELSMAVGEEIPEALADEVPIFINHERLKEIHSLAELSEALAGRQPDFLHATTNYLSCALREIARQSTARSERTGDYIRLSAGRFRRTRGTKLRREGFGPAVIAELLDHSNTSNVGIYTANTANEAIVIDRAVGSRLAPFAQACLGRLVHSEREAVRGDDPRSRVPNGDQDPVGTCGNYGFCAEGFRACYTCSFFQPWVDGPHEAVLESLYEEKERARVAGCAESVVNATDQLILAVEHCIQLCSDARNAAAQVVVEAH